jgi:hypothetical protein
MKEVSALLEERIAHLRRLTHEQALALPETASEKAGAIALTTFRQALGPELCLVTVQAARRRFLGLVSFHTERGVVFALGVEPREATNAELQNSGG